MRSSAGKLAGMADDDIEQFNRRARPGGRPSAEIGHGRPEMKAERIGRIRRLRAPLAPAARGDAA